MEKNMNELAKFPLFEQVTKTTLDKIWELGTVTAYKRGEHIFDAREENPYVYFLLSGTVSIYNLTHSGKRKILFYLGPGSLLNDQLKIDSTPTVSCQSIDEVDIFYISKRDFLSLMAKDFSLTEVILSDFERKMFRMSHQLKNTMGCVNLERKVASKLWKLSRDFGITVEKGILINIPLNITELADFVGAPRESVSRAMKKLVEKGFIEMEAKKIYVVDAPKLSKYYKTGVI